MTPIDIQKHHVGEFLFAPGRVEAVQPTGRQQPRAADADQVHQAVPVDFQRADGQGHRVDLRVRQHCDSSLELKPSNSRMTLSRQD